MSRKLIKRAEGFKDDVSKLEAQSLNFRLWYNDMLTPAENDKLVQYEKDLEAIHQRAVEYFNKVLYQ